MTDQTYYVLRGADSGGDGLANVETDQGDGHWACQSIALAEVESRAVAWGGTDRVTIVCGAGTGSAGDTTQVTFLAANWSNVPGFVDVLAVDDRHGREFDTTKYHLDYPTPWAQDFTFELACEFSFKHLQVDKTSNNSAIFQIADAVTHVQITHNIMRGDGGGNEDIIRMPANGISGDFVYADNVAYGLGGSFLTSAGWMANPMNFAAYDNTHSGFTGTGFNTIGGFGATWYLKGNVADSCGTDIGSGWDATHNNYTSDATSPDGASFQNKSIVFDSAADFGISPGFGDNDDLIGGGSGLDTDPDGVYSVVDDVIQASRSATTPTAGAFEYVASGTLATMDFQILYRLASLAQNDMQFLSAVHNLAGVDTQCLYSINNLAEKDVALPYSIHELVGTDHQLLNAINALSSTDVQLLFDVRQLVTHDSQLLYTVLENLNVDFSVLYRIAQLVNADSEFLYEIVANGEATMDMQLIYQMSGLVNSDFQALYSVKNLVNKDTQFLNAISQHATLNVELLSAVYQLVSHDMQLPSHVLNLVSKDTAITSQIMSLTTSDFQALYKMSALSTRDVELPYALRHLSSTDLLILYRLGFLVLADIEARVQIKNSFQSTLQTGSPFDARTAINTPFKGKFQINH